MPYGMWDEVNDAIKGISPRVTLEQANLIARWADAMEEAEDGPENAWAAAIAQFKDLFEVVDGRWVRSNDVEGHMAYRMRVVTHQISATYRVERVGRRQYLVAPVVAIAEGVLKGELVPEEEIARSCGSWSGRPVVIGHPKENGKHVSANRPEILEQIEVGKFYPYEKECDAVSDGRLRGEVWVDLNKAKQTPAGKEVIVRLRSGTPTEVSTAYWRDSERAEGKWEGERYKAISRNLRPDHLALILDGEGECNWKDGCGVPRVNEASLGQLEQIVTEAWYDQHSEGYVFRVYRDYLITEWEDGFLRYEYEYDEDEGEVVFDEGVRVEFVAVEDDGVESQEMDEGWLKKVSAYVANRFGLTEQEQMEEDGMDERIEMILDDGRFPSLTQETLEAMEEAELDLLHNLVAEPEEEDVEEPVVEETEEEEEPEADEPTSLSQEEPEPVVNVDVKGAVQEALEAHLKDIGGLDEVRRVVSQAKEKEHAEKERVIKRVLANDRCEYEREELEAFPTLEALKKLERTMSPSSFVGQGGFSPEGQEPELEEYDVPVKL